MIQLLRLYEPSMGGPVLVPGQGAKILHVTAERCHMLQLGPGTPK